jgi:hypothetical protein
LSPGEPETVRVVELLDSLQHPKAGPDRPLRIVAVRDRRAEDGHHRIADELLDDAAVLLDARLYLRVVELERVADVLRVGAVRPRRELDEIDEEDRDELALLLECGSRELGPAGVAEPRPCRVLRPAAGTLHERFLGAAHEDIFAQIAARIGCWP